MVEEHRQGAKKERGDNLPWHIPLEGACAYTVLCLTTPKS